jgi:hypothetical protein
MSADCGKNGRLWLSSNVLLTNPADSTRCDQHGEKVDFASFGLGDVLDGEQSRQWQFIRVTFGPEGEDHERKGGDREELEKVLIAWRQETYDSDPIGFLYEIEDILTDEGIGIIAKVPPSRLYRDRPEGIIKELKETAEWGSRRARGIFEQVWKHDHGDSSRVPTYEQQQCKCSLRV